MATELIPVVDLRVLSQSELATLALSSPNAFDLRRCDDVVVPKIDRSVFNESAGSRKQTYSRLRLDPPKSDSQSSPPSLPRRRGRPRTIPLRSAAGTSASTTAIAATGEPVASEDSTSDRDRRDNLLIASFLRRLFSQEDPTSQSLALANTVSSVFENEKNECGRDAPFGTEVAQKALVLADDGDQEMLNSKGEAVDLVALGQIVDPFGEELRRRTQGLRTEEQLLGFLSSLEGQWVSRRKRRRFVDASIFGDMLPRGWKLMLGLKRKEGVAWLNCRRYVSPKGHQFVSCKEVSSYILSLHGSLPPVSIQEDDIAPSSEKVTYASNAGKIHHVISNGSSSFSSATPVSYVSDYHQKQPDGTSCYNATPISYISCGTENQHPFPSPRGCAKRRKRGKVIADKVIMRDGKYECQICHRTFSEKHRYNGHVGAHVRYQGLDMEALPNEGSAGKGTDHSSWALVPHSFENDISVLKNVESLTTPLVTELKSTSTFEGQAETSIAKSVVDVHCERIFEEGISARNDPNECLESKFTSSSDLTTAPQENSPMVTQEASPCKLVDCEVKDFAKTSNNASITNDQKAFQEENVSNNTKCLLSTCSNNSISVAADVTTFPSSISKIVNANTDALDRENAHSESNDVVEISSSIDEPNGVVSAYQAKVDDADCNLDEVAFSVSESKSVNYLPLASVNVESIIACEAINVDVLPSSPDQSNAYEKSDCNSTKDNSVNVDDTSNFIDVDTSTCYELSLSLMDMDAKANDKHAEINHARSNLSSGFEKFDDKLMVDVQNDFMNLTGNLSSNGTEMYTELCTGTVEEHAQKQIPNNGQVETENHHELSDNDACFPRMYNTLQNSFSNVSFCGKYIQDIGTNTGCLFRTDINESVLQAIDRPVNELEMFFSDSNSDHQGNGADEMVTDDDASQVVQINLVNSSGMQANNDLRVLDMLPDRCGELEDISEKNVNLQGFEELRLGSIEPSDFSLFTGQELRNLVEPSMALGFASELEDQQCLSLQLGWNISLSNMDNASITYLCVWCNSEFRHNHGHVEPHLDTVGYICKACKGKFSGS